VIAAEVTHSGGDLFRAGIAEVAHTHLNDDGTMVVVEWWTPRTGYE
jgi:hypothetical protein